MINQYKQYVQRVTRITVCPPGEPIFGAKCTHITIEDEAAGEYINIQQQTDEQVDQQIAINDRDEWGHICEAVDRLFNVIRDNEPDE